MLTAVAWKVIGYGRNTIRYSLRLALLHTIPITVGVSIDSILRQTKDNIINLSPDLEEMGSGFALNYTSTY